MSDEKQTPVATGIRITIPVAIAFVAIAALVGAGTALTLQKVDAQDHSSTAPLSASTGDSVGDSNALEPEAEDGWEVFPPANAEPQSDQWNPFQEMQAMQERMDKLFNESWMRLHSSPFQPSLSTPLTESPNIDVTETDTEYVVHVDMPGIDQANAEVTIEGDLLTIGATRVDTIEDAQGGQMIRQERRASRFQRTMSLPGPVDAAQMTTQYADGVLTVRIPKQNQEMQSPIAHGPIQ